MPSHSLDGSESACHQNHYSRRPVPNPNSAGCVAPILGTAELHKKDHVLRFFLVQPIIVNSITVFFRELEVEKTITSRFISDVSCSISIPTKTKAA